MSNSLADKMIAAVEGYIEHFNAQDYNAIAGLYAENATVEDPVGTALKKGREEIRAFYENAVSGGTKLALTAPIRVAEREAAFAFQAIVKTEQGNMTIDIIDTFAFNDAGEVTQMRAFWGQRNMTMGK